MINTVIIQPPMVQLNTPYPSGAYLFSFFKNLYKTNNYDGDIRWFDLSNELFHAVFCKTGLKSIFEKCTQKALEKANEFEMQGDDNTAFQLRRFVSEYDLWCSWVDLIVAVVCKKDISGREFVHEFVRSAHVPRGNRMEQYLSKLNADVSPDDAEILCTLALADISDFINFTYDSNFSLIRYAEQSATSTSTFSQVEKELKAPVLIDFYEKILIQKLEKCKDKKTVWLISVPFPGTFEAALFTARTIKETSGSNALVCLGGGFVNTELRSIKEEKLFNYCDILSYDKGYGSYKQLFENLKSYNFDLSAFKSFLEGQNTASFYKIKYRGKENKIVFEEKNADILAEYDIYEKKLIRFISPDYSEIDFKKYPHLADDKNPMHRIWNDGTWLKVYLAYGCYWHRCAFCDTTIDYVKNYCCTDVEKLYDSLRKQSEKTGVYGLHFVDEACPPSLLQKFSLLNLNAAKNSHKFTFWGNIRFEKSFTRDMADLLAFGGMTAVSAGLEIATGKGLNSINKGIDLKNVVYACCAFKEAGILVHSYMIFGFWNQSKEDLINSMETLRQLFEVGLIDSAFWHKFSLTLHSTVYDEWKKGKYPELKPILGKKEQFAENDIHFAGEEESEKYSLPLNYALDCWMHGEKLSKNVESYFDFKMPRPTISRNFVKDLIEEYENFRDSSFNKMPCENEEFIWIGGKPIILLANSGKQLCWSYMGELLYCDINKKDEKEIPALLEKIKAENYYCSDKKDFYGINLISIMGKNLFSQLRGKGLCRVK